jgi:hypothetical protein
VCKQVPKARRPAFDSYIILIAWCLWWERNDHTFNNISNPPAKVVDFVSEQCELWCQAGLCSRLLVLGM